MQNIMSMAFRHAASLCESIELIEAFKLMAHRHPIYLCVEQMGQQVFLCFVFSQSDIFLFLLKQIDRIRHYLL